MKKSLYVCYFGLREPLVQTQVLPYLREVVKDGVEMHLLTFEPELKEWKVDEIAETEAKLLSEGIRWHRLAYHKWPSVPATIYDLAVGTLKVLTLGRKYRFDIYHSRGHIPAPIAVVAKKLLGGKVLFDIRGFMPEEYADAGIWKHGSLLFTVAKRIESWLMRSADGFVILTNRAKEVLFPNIGDSTVDANDRPVEVIPCCVDLSRFSFSERSSTGTVDEFVLIYVGSLGGWYLSDEMAELMHAVSDRNADSRFVVLTQRDVEQAREQLLKCGLAETKLLVTSAMPDEVATHLAGATAAVSFIKPCYSKLSSSPTKVAEYLAMGLPVICNSGVGDIDKLIIENRVGVIVNDLDLGGYEKALTQLDSLLSEPGVRRRCRDTAELLFDLESVGGVRYRRLYSALLN